MVAFDAAALQRALADEDPFCPEPPSGASTAGGWTEARLRHWYENGGTHDVGDVDQGPTREQARWPWWGSRSLVAPPARLPRYLPLPSRSRSCLAAQLLAKFPAPPKAEFERWFPGLERRDSQTWSASTTPRPAEA